MNHRRKGFVLAWASVLFTSTGPLLNKLATQTCDPVSAAFYCSVFAAMFVFTHERLLGRQFKFKLNRPLILSGILNGAAFVLLFKSVVILQPGTVAFIGRFYIVFSLVLGALFLGERFSFYEGIFVLISVAAVFIFTSSGSLAFRTLGVTYAFLYTFSFAAANLVAKASIKQNSPSSVVFFNNAIAAVFILGVKVSAGGFVFASRTSIGYLLLVAFASGFVGLLLYYKSLKYISYSHANLCRATSPIFVVLYSYPFFPTHFTTKETIGGIILLLSVAALAVGGHKSIQVVESEINKKVKGEKLQSPA